jgi:hypothetical protein
LNARQRKKTIDGGERLMHREPGVDMAEHSTITEILEYILSRASSYELELIGAALRKRLERGSGPGARLVDVQNMARSMADSIKKQMNIGAGNVHQMSRRLVADMIRKEKPDIGEAELQKLVDMFVPDRGSRNANAGGIPKDMLLAMITQFLAYSTGEMSEGEKKQFPAGWYNRYWDAFPADIQNLLRDYIHGRIGKDQFWKGIRESPAMM